MVFSSLLKSFFLKLNLNITQLTSYQDIKNFYSKIKPKKFPSINIIRLGEDGDGGYFVPDFIKDFEVSIKSPSLDQNIAKSKYIQQKKEITIQPELIEIKSKVKDILNQNNVQTKTKKSSRHR